MDSVWDALGLTEAMQRLVSDFSRGTVTQALVRGRSGTGKTRFTGAIAERLTALDFHPLALRGDIVRFNQEYYPFFNLLRTRNAASDRQDVLSAAADDLPVGRNLVKRAVEMVGSYIERHRLKSTLGVHDAVATEIVALLRGRVRRRKTLLILDDVHAFDAHTIRILGQVAAAPAEFLGKHAYRLCILAAENTEEAEQNVDPVRERMLRRFYHVELERCGRGRFPDLLTSLGFATDLQTPVVDDLFNRSGAHLRVLAELARHLSSSSAAIDLYAQRNLLDLVLTLRLSEPAAHERNVQPVLARVAILGTTFTRLEVQCLLDDVERPELNETLQKSIELSLLDAEGPVLSFQHSSIRDFFLRAAPREQPRYHEVFASCLRALRPSDYAARMMHLEAAGKAVEADITRVLHWSRQSRNGRTAEPPRFSAVDYGDYVAQLRVAHEMMQHNQEVAAIPILEAIHDSYPDVLLVERDLVLAECHLEDITYVSFQKALDLLSPWQDVLQDELELRTRVLYLLAMARTLRAEYKIADSLFTILMRELAPVRHTDPGLQRMLNRVHLVSDCLHSIEISGRRIYSALAALLAAKEQGRAFNPLDLYLALTNHSGNQLITGEYTASASYAQAAVELGNDFGEFEFPSPVAALNNHLLADLLNGTATAKETLAGFRNLTGGVDNLHDHVLLCVNYANVLCLAGHIPESLDLLTEIRTTLREKGQCDEYYVFYAEHALAAALLLSGSRRQAKMVWGGLEPLMEKLPPGLLEYLPHRHALLRPAFDDHSVIRPEHWNEYLRDTDIYRGRPWRFFQNGFLFTDIQYWFHL
jgi:hypothetical protein